MPSDSETASTQFSGRGSLTVGLVGIGLLGSAMAETLLRSGHRVIGFDLRAECRERLRTLGGTAADSPSEVFRQCRTVVLSLPDSSIVSKMICGLNESETRISSGTLIIDTTTGSPRDSQVLGQALSEQGVDYLDATVLGSSEQTRQRDVVVMVGGRAEAFQRAIPVLDCFAVRHFHVGECGKGATAKLIVNLVLGLNRAVLAEGLSLAKRCDMDLPLMLEILRSGAAWSRVMDTKGSRMIDENFEPQARLDQHWKDVRLILELGRHSGSWLPLSEVHDRILQQASAMGCGQLDNSAVIRAYDSPNS